MTANDGRARTRPARTKTKETTEWKDADTRVFTMYAPDGKTPVMRITYKRRK